MNKTEKVTTRIIIIATWLHIKNIGTLFATLFHIERRHAAAILV